ncbi:MAG TPA: hypothetical protein GX699_06985 [Firmicutes bacterium]|jgi:hypothetical protein|nr:hypothetical protein [Bacillota bacterium]
MYYYVCCPVCNQDLSRFVDEENPREDSIYCIKCETALRLRYGTQYDADMGGEITLFWLEREDAKGKA